MATTFSPVQAARPGSAHGPEPRTKVNTVEDSPPEVHRPRRVLSTTTREERTILGCSMVAGVALAWVVCFRLLPWGSPLAFTITAFVAYLAVLTVATALVSPGPPVLDRLAAALVTGGAAIVGIALVSTVAFTFIRGAPALPHLNIFTSDMAGVGPSDPLTSGGVLHAIVGSLIQITIAVTVTLPLALGTAVFMTEVGGRFARVVRTIVEAMTALPSIVAGLFIYTVLLLWLGVPRSGVAAAMALSVMMLPIIARAADVVLRVVPSGLREASLALGASRWRTVWHVVLPTARPGLATALILGIARGVGETSPVLLTSGASSFLVTDPFHNAMNSLPLFVFSTVRSGQPIYIERGFAAATVLLAFVLTLFVVTRVLARHRKGR